MFCRNIIPELMPNEIKQVDFVSVPKTASANLTYSEPHPKFKYLGHCFAKQAYRLGRNMEVNCWDHLEKNPKHLTFSIIRNPFDLLCSYYFHDDPDLDGSGWSSCNFIHGFRSFEDFIIAYCDKDFAWHSPEHKRFLFSQLFDANGKCAVDLIFVYEYLNEAVEKTNIYLRDKIIQFHPDKCVNKSKRKTEPYQYYYSQQMRKMVEEKCKMELDMFCYCFDGINKRKKACFIFPKRITFL